MIGSPSAQTQPTQLPAIKPGTHTSFGPLKQIDASLLNVGYAEAGRANGPAVILLHGCPYDIHSFVDVAPLLASAGYRVIGTVSAWLRHNAISFRRHVSQWPAVGGRSRYHRLDGCSQDPESDPRRV
jgi:pimeloyl-ACP methyl ester carboxylesterase